MISNNKQGKDHDSFVTDEHTEAGGKVRIILSHTQPVNGRAGI